MNDNSGIDYHTVGGTMIYGPDGIAFLRAITMASGLRLYAKTGIRPNRAYTPTAMMIVAAEITGRKFKARDYERAAAALTDWAQTMKSALPKTLDGKEIA